MSTLAVVEEILRETSMPMSVREIVERAGARLPSKSKTPDTVVARDLSMDIKKKGEGSMFVRTSPGRYTLRALVPQQQPERDPAEVLRAATPVAAQAPAVSAAPNAPMPQVGSDRLPGPLAARKPAAPAGPAARPAGRDSAEGGGYAG